MSEAEAQSRRRADMRRRMATRAALLRAAREILAESGPGVSVQAITRRADVGVGSLYNHFGTKESLFREAIGEAFEEFEADLVERTSAIAEGAELLCTRFRLVALCPETHPVTARLTLQPPGLQPRTLVNPLRATEDVAATIREGGLDADLAPQLLVLVSAAAMHLVTLGATTGAVDRAGVDTMAEAAMIAMGLPRERARALAHLPLPPLPAPAA